MSRDLAVPDEEAAVRALRAEGLEPRGWGNGPGDTYGGHAHDYDKVLYCVAGAITFHTPDGDLALSAGDRLDLPSGVRHAATVGRDGVRCVEAARPSGGEPRRRRRGLSRSRAGALLSA